MYANRNVLVHVTRGRRRGGGDDDDGGVKGGGGRRAGCRAGGGGDDDRCRECYRIHRLLSEAGSQK